MQKFFPKLKLKDVCLLALFTALYVVFSQILSFRAGPVKIGFSFIAVAFAAYLYGVTGGVIAAGLGDFIGALLFPVGGAYFAGFTLSAALTGAIYGVALKSRKYSILSAFLAVIPSQVICSLFLNTIFNVILYDAGFVAFLIKRLVQFAVMVPLQIILMHLLIKLAGKRLENEIK